MIFFPAFRPAKTVTISLTITFETLLVKVWILQCSMKRFYYYCKMVNNLNSITQPLNYLLGLHNFCPSNVFLLLPCAIQHYQEYASQRQFLSKNLRKKLQIRLNATVFIVKACRKSNQSYAARLSLKIITILLLFHISGYYEHNIKHPHRNYF